MTKPELHRLEELAAHFVELLGATLVRQLLVAQLALLSLTPEVEVLSRHGRGVVRARGYHHDSKRESDFLRSETVVSDIAES
jgi:hypothetical protein